jgi:hypothetical protein
MSIGGGGDIAQSEAMLRYVGTLGDSSLYPNDVIPRLKIDEACCLAADMDSALMPSLYLAMRPLSLGYPAEFPKADEGKAKIKCDRPWAER